METSYQLLCLEGGGPGVGLAAIADNMKQRERTANLRLSNSLVTTLSYPASQIYSRDSQSKYIKYIPSYEERLLNSRLSVMIITYLLHGAESFLRS